MKFIELEQGTPEWLAWRKEGISATESAVILGVSPWKSAWQLWAEKRGLSEPPDLSAVPAIRFGHDNEDVARNMWCEKHDTLAFPACAEYDENPIFRASFDGLTPDDEPLEIKCPQENTLADVRENGTGSHAYQLYYIQVQHQLLVSGARKGTLIFLDGDHLIEFEIQRDQPMIDRILAEGAAFHEKVVKGIEPEKDPKRDSMPLDEAEEARWSELAGKYLRNEEKLAVVEEMLKAFDGIRKEQEEIKAELTKMVDSKGFKTCKHAGLSVVRVVTKGRLNVKAYMKEKGITEEDLAPFYGKETVSWRLRKADSEVEDLVLKAASETKPEPKREAPKPKVAKVADPPKPKAEVAPAAKEPEAKPEAKKRSRKPAAKATEQPVSPPAPAKTAEPDDEDGSLWL